MSVWHFICKVCGPSDIPCEHAMRDTELRVLRDFRERQESAHEEMRNCCKQLRHMLLEIIHILNRPQSATLRLLSGGTMPATILVGGTANSLFQEWTGPNGTGTVVPNAGAPAFSSDNPAVATVDPATGVATGVAPGTANISGTDPANGLTASDVLTVNAVVQPAVSATLTLTPN